MAAKKPILLMNSVTNRKSQHGYVYMYVCKLNLACTQYSIHMITNINATQRSNMKANSLYKTHVHTSTITFIVHYSRYKKENQIEEAEKRKE